MTKNWKEEDLFNWIKEEYLSDLAMAINQFSRWDSYSLKSRIRIEFKCRSKHFDSLLIEKKKYDALISKSVPNKDIPYYINSTPEGVYAFKLEDLNPEWQTKQYPATTQFNNRRRVPKEVAFLDIELARKLK